MSESPVVVTTFLYKKNDRRKTNDLRPLSTSFNYWQMSWRRSLRRLKRLLQRTCSRRNYSSSSQAFLAFIFITHKANVSVFSISCFPALFLQLRHNSMQTSLLYLTVLHDIINSVFTQAAKIIHRTPSSIVFAGKIIFVL